MASGKARRHDITQMARSWATCLQIVKNVNLFGVNLVLMRENTLKSNKTDGKEVGRLLGEKNYKFSKNFKILNL